LKFLANENVPLKSIQILVSKGIDIIGIGLEYPSVSDKEVMQIAIDQNRTIITYDSDYGELIFKFGYKPHAGVIYIRKQPKNPLETVETIESLLTNQAIKLENYLTVIDATSIRQRKING
jgi:predicted nuclease of predicted toxin-antitoxin system